MKMNKALTDKEKAVIIFLFLVLCFAAYWNFVQRPVTEALELCAQQTSDLETSIAILSAKKQKQDAMQEELAEIKAKGNAPVVPDYDNLDSEMAFLYDVLASTQEYSLSVASVAKSTEGSANIVRRSMSLDFSADSYAAGKMAVKKLQESRYCCRLGAMSMSRASNESRSIVEGPVNININITFFELQKKK